MRKVLITGTSSGIGKTLVEYLSQKNFFIYATARTPKDIQNLNQMPNVKGIRLDITKPQDIKNAQQIVLKDGNELYGLVNNAGILDVGPIFDYSIQTIQKIFNVNLFGMMRMTNAFLPMLRASQGRIIINSSMSGILSERGAGTYSITKHAVEAYGDTLFYDLQDTGVKVSLLEPGNYKSKLFNKYIDRLDSDTSAGPKFSTNNDRNKFIDRMGEIAAKDAKYPEPVDVAKAVEEALLAENPLMRYMVGPRNEKDLVINRMFEELLQLNAYPDSLTKNQLISRLEEIWDVTFKN